MKIGLSVSVVSFSAFAAVSNISVTAEAAYVAADVAAKTIIFDSADRPFVLPQTNLASDSVTVSDVGDGVDVEIDLQKDFETFKTDGPDITDSDPVFLVEPDFSDSVIVTDAQFVVTFDDVADFDPSTPAVDFDPVSITEADAKDVTIAELADNDNVSVTEAISNNPDIPKSDAVTATEVSVLNPQLVKSETLAPTDAVDDFDVGKVLADSVSVTEAIENEVTLPQSDSVSAVQSNVKTFTSNVDFDLSDADVDPDPVTATDAIDDFDFSKGVTDTASVTESDAKNVTVAELADSDTASVVESIALNPENVLTDSLTAVEGIKLNPSLPKSDAVSATEAQVFDMRPELSDTATATESINTTLTLGESDYVYPDFVSVSDGYRGGFIEEPYSYTISSVEYFVPFTGVLGAAETLNTVVLNADRVTAPDTSSSGLVVNFHYTDVDEDDRVMGGYMYNQTPLCAGNSTVGQRAIL
ncbi:MAG: hypothetical protein CMO33_09955 [Verrucomicrobia bacterium]|nr:hypothetical protein [Verrucomicrobiota bacterium]